MAYKHVAHSAAMDANLEMNTSHGPAAEGDQDEQADIGLRAFVNARTWLTSATYEFPGSC